MEIKLGTINRLRVSVQCGLSEREESYYMLELR